MRAPDPSPPILIIGPSWVGDMVMASSLIAALRMRYPGRAIDVAAPPASLPIASLIEGVRNTIPIGLGHGDFGFSKRWKLGKSLRANQYGLAIVLPRAFKAAIVPFAARVPIRVGYAAEGRSFLLTDARHDGARKSARTIDRFVALSAPKGQTVAYTPRPVLQPPDISDETLAIKFGLTPGSKVLGLCPGAEFGPAKQWPAAKFASLARMAQIAGYSVQIFGGPKDRAIAEEIASLADVPVRNFAGETSLVEAAALLARCAVVVSNDSGLMHVAGALDRPLVALYGSSSEKMTPPTGPLSEVLSLELDCRPCFQRTCPLGTLACLEGIGAKSAFEAVERMAVAGSLPY